MIARLSASALFAFALGGEARAADALDVFGEWLTQKQTSIVEIADCGDASPCGAIVWIDHPDPDSLTDEENPEAALQARPLMGLTVLDSFEPRKNQWKKGRIYDPETGKTYGSRLRRLEDGTLQVKGCIGPICQTQIWTPAAAPPDATSAATTAAGAE